ncbi:cytochrome P450 protein [Arthrobacter sp. Hiyo8]|nr:cytochrome P450 protein [Arthrobacter sp. Hiyo8]
MNTTTAGAQTCPYLVLREPAAVREVLHRPEDFSPANALIAVTPLSGPSLRVLQRARFALPPVLASNDTASHAGIRKVVAGFFTRQRWVLLSRASAASLGMPLPPLLACWKRVGKWIWCRPWQRTRRRS